MDLEKTIFERRSVRDYKDKPVNDDTIKKILKAGIWAPSGLNNQPWKFKVIQAKDIINKLAGFTKYSHIIKAAPVSICVFLDKTTMYNRDKDILAIGACVQNMLLFAHAQGIGSCWLGEILNRKEEVRKFLEVEDDFELMAVISFGYISNKSGKSSRKKLDSFILK